MGLWDCHCEKRGELGRGEESAQRESDRKRQRHGGQANRETDTHTHTHTSWICRPRREVKTLGQVGQAVQRTTQADPCLPPGAWLHPPTLRTRLRHWRGQQGPSGQSECEAEARPHVWGWPEVPRSCWELHTWVGALSFSCTLTHIHTLYTLIRSLANHTHIASHRFRRTHWHTHPSTPSFPPGNRLQSIRVLHGHAPFSVSPGGPGKELQGERLSSLPVQLPRCPSWGASCSPPKSGKL